TEIHPLGAEDVANLAQHLLNPNVRAHVASTVVSRKEKLQLFSGLPGPVATKHPSGFGALDVRTDPCFQDKIHHAEAPPRAAGQGWYVYSKLFSRLNFSNGKLYCENGTGLRPNSEVTRVLSITVFQTR